LDVRAWEIDLPSRWCFVVQKKVGKVVVVDHIHNFEQRRIALRGDGDVLVTVLMNDNSNRIYNLHNL
jgi:hypothetical protein